MTTTSERIAGDVKKHITSKVLSTDLEATSLPEALKLSLSNHARRLLPKLTDLVSKGSVAYKAEAEMACTQIEKLLAKRLVAILKAHYKL